MSDDVQADDAILERLTQTERLLQAHKYRHTVAVAASDDAAAIGELDAITKLELRLDNIRTCLRLRRLTRG